MGRASNAPLPPLLARPQHNPHSQQSHRTSKQANHTHTQSGGAACLGAHVGLELLEGVLAFDEGHHLGGGVGNHRRAWGEGGEKAWLRGRCGGRGAHPPALPLAHPGAPHLSARPPAIARTLCSGSVKRSLILFSPFHDSLWILRSTKHSLGSLGPYLRAGGEGRREAGVCGGVGWGGGAFGGGRVGGGAWRRARAPLCCDMQTTTELHVRPSRQGAHQRTRSAIAPGFLSSLPW